MKNKLISPLAAAKIIQSGDSIMYGGFIGVGTPESIIDAMLTVGQKDLVIIGNDTGKPGVGVSKLIAADMVKKVVTSHIGLNPDTGARMLAGTLKVQLVPQGTLAERIRAGGFGLGGFLTPTGVGTEVAEGKQVINVDGKDYLLEKPLRARVGLIRGSIVDKSGNIYYKGMSQNFCPLIAPACDIVIVEAEKLVEVGEISPEAVATPGVYVDYIVVPNAENGKGA